MSEYSYNADAKEATVFTKQHNAAFAQQFAIDLEDAYNSEVALARRGCLKKLDGFRLKDKTGNVVWDLQAYDFLKQQAVADTVHPSLWLNGKANIEAGVFEVLAGKIYQVRGIDVANLTFVRSKTGWIVIDVTTNTEAAAYGLRITEEVLGENIRDHIRAVIISHSHADHFGGIKGIVSPQQVGKAEGQVRIYVPAGFDEETVKENVYAGTAMFHRSKYQFGGDLLAGPKGRVSTGLGLGTSSGTLSYITPTDFIAEDTTLTIDGLEVEFQLTPGTEAPAEMNNYFPEYRAFWAAENCTGTLHNLYPIRGAQLRDAANWWRFTAIALERYGKQADVVFQSHNWPHWNTPETPHGVEDFLRNNAAVYKYIHDRTLHLANQGRTAKEIAREVVLPEKLAKVWYTRPYYGFCGDQRTGSLLQISGLLQRQPHRTERSDRNRGSQAVCGICGFCGAGAASGGAGLCRRQLSPCRKGSFLCGICRTVKPAGTAAERRRSGTAGVPVGIRHLAECVSKRCL